MHPVLFHWHGIKVYSYSAMFYLGLILGIVAGNYEAHLIGLNSARSFIAIFLLLIPALVGARLLFVMTHWNCYRYNRRRIWRRSEGGAILYGGLFLSLLVSVPLLSILQLPFGAFWDLATFTILTAMIFARLGCLLHGCCAGRATTGWLALYAPNSQGIWRRRIPTPILEAGLAAVLLVGAVATWQHMPFRGALLLSVLVGYGAGRFLLEFTREGQPKVGKVTLQQAISVVLVVLSLAVLSVATVQVGVAR